MKKTLCVLLCMLMVYCFAACGDEEEETVEYTYEIAMLTAAENVSIDDGGYTQATWEGLREFADEQQITYKYYEPEEASTESRLARLDEAVNGGAKVVICVGDEMAETVYEAQDKYNDITFIYIDGIPANGKGKRKIADNCICISFNQAEAGFLAGYAAVAEGLDDLGFIARGKSSNAKTYGYGFVQGCHAAADNFDYYAEIKYSYGKADDSAAKIQKKAKNWYEEGTEVIFTYGDDVFDLVKEEAEDAKAAVMASDVDKDYSKTVITSALKHYDVAVKTQLEAIYGEKFEGGKTITLGTKADAVGLDMKKSKFDRFTKDDYKEIYKELAKGEFKPASTKGIDKVSELVSEKGLYYVDVEYVD